MKSETILRLSDGYRLSGIELSIVTDEGDGEGEPMLSICTFDGDGAHPSALTLVEARVLHATLGRALERLA